MFKELKRKQFDILTLHHAEAVLTHDMPEAIRDIESVLLQLDIPIDELVSGGGGEAQSTQRLRRSLNDLGWPKAKIEISKVVDGKNVASITHEIDHIKKFGSEDWPVALEIEWNNKDPFFDRDLENFKRLHAEGAISVGVIVTRGQKLHGNMRAIIQRFASKHGISDFADLEAFGYAPTRRQKSMIEKRLGSHGDFSRAWSDVFVSDKFGEATTHWNKLAERVKRGVGNPCPLVLIGIPDSVVSL